MLKSIKHTSRNIVLCVILMTICNTILAQTLIRGKILDRDTNQPVTNAKFGIIEQGIGVFTNDEGRFSYQKYHEVLDDGQHFKITAEGYQTIEGDVIFLQKLQEKHGLFYLERNKHQIKDQNDALSPKFNVLWDASEISAERKVELELAYLITFLKNTDWATVTLLIVNDTLSSYQYQVVDPQVFERMQSTIESVQYSGTSNYAEVKETPLKSDAILMFAGTPPTFGTLWIDPDIPVYTVSSGNNVVGNTYLERLANFTGGTFQLLSSDSDKPVSDQRRITGKVSTTDGPVPYARISNVNNLEEIITDVDGNFEMNATIGERYTVYSLGNYPNTFSITDKEDYRIEIVSKAEKLAQVELKTKKTRSRYAFDSVMQLDVVEGRTVPVRSLHKSQFNKQAFNVHEAIQGRYGVFSYFSYVKGKYITTVKGKCARVFIDGVEAPLNAVSVHRIENISIYDSPSINKCPSRIIITTSVHPDILDKRLRKKGLEPQEGNQYDEDVATLDFTSARESYFPKEIRTYPVEDQFRMYKEQLALHRNSVDFYVSMATYFGGLEPELALNVCSDFSIVAKDNVKALRVLAYLYEMSSDFTSASLVYKRVLKLAPHQPQSYRDLALAYQEAGKYKKAFLLYVNMLNDNVPGVSFSAYGKVITNEFQRLLTLHKHKVDYSKLPNDWMAVGFNIDLRLTASWSDPQAPFEFQFVNPENRYYNWKSNSSLYSQPDNKVATEEFVIDDALPGNWLVNVRYIGDEKVGLIPPYLKYTLYKN
ncbi:MAG: hypothetical protein R3359_03885, partial [Marinirhabdus sp.]|nr:hypothetical protein [Marinirhabdus sp.]